MNAKVLYLSLYVLSVLVGKSACELRVAVGARPEPKAQLELVPGPAAQQIQLLCQTSPVRRLLPRLPRARRRTAPPPIPQNCGLRRPRAQNDPGTQPNRGKHD